jgi:outer membrane murein-binding lipoprotein Lpp
MTLRVAAAFSILLLAGCASDARSDSARAWQVAECNRVIDKEDRDRCIRRAEEDYGRRAREAEPRRK